MLFYQRITKEPVRNFNPSLSAICLFQTISGRLKTSKKDQ